MSKLLDRVIAACEINNCIVVDRREARQHPGFALEYFERLGLSKADLKRLESKGLALRGYTKNVWLAGEKTPNGKEVPEGYIAKGTGHRVRWILIADRGE